MSLASLESTVNTVFDARDGISTATKGEVRDAVDQALELPTMAKCGWPSVTPAASGKSISG